MKKSLLSLALMLLISSFSIINAQDTEETSYNHAKNYLLIETQNLNIPMLNNGTNVAGKKFNATDFLELIQMPDAQRAAYERKLYDTPNSPTWFESTVNEDGHLNIIYNKSEKEQYSYTILAGYLENIEYQEVKFKATSTSAFDLYLDGEKIISNKEFCKENNTKEKSLKLEIGKHDIIVKSLNKNNSECDWNFKFEFTGENSESLIWNTDPTKNMDLYTVMNGIRLAGTSISPCGNYVKYSYRETLAPEGKSFSWSEIIDLRDNSTIINTRYNNIGGVYFHPSEAAVYFRKNDNGKSQVYMQNLENGKVTLLMEASKDMNSYAISNDGNFIIYGINIKGEKSPDGVHRLDGMEDRWPWWRNQTDLYHYDINTGLHSQLTAGELSTSLHDINNDGNKIIVSQSVRDYTTRPYSKQITMEINLTDFSIDTLWTDYFGGSATYSPDGKQLLVAG